MHLLLLFLLMLVPAAARAQEPAAASTIAESTVTVRATGTARRTPDQAVLMLAVESFAATAAEATSQNAAKMEALLSALRGLGLAGEKIRTTSYRLSPEYDRRRPPEPRSPGEDRLVGFRALNMVRVTIDDVERVGAVIDAAVAAGANRVTGLSFQLRDPDSARHEAVREAVAKARAEAETVARALGRGLGPALSVNTTGFIPPPGPMMMRAEYAARDMAVPTPIEPGALEVTATVTAVYALEPPQ